MFYNDTIYFTKEEVKLVMDGKAILAVKSVRDRCGLGLREAKSVVDDLLELLGLAGYKECEVCRGTGKVHYYGKFKMVPVEVEDRLD